jgi:hypothetical protein
MTAILAINLSRSSLRAVVRDPAVRLDVHIEHLGECGTRCLVDGRSIDFCSPPRDVNEAITLVAELVRTRGVVVAAVAHRISASDPGRPEAELIDDGLIVKLGDLCDAAQLQSELGAVEAARVAWQNVPHVACFGGLDAHAEADAVLDRQARALLRRAEHGTVPAREGDDRAEQMLANPRSYFVRAREKARVEVERDIARRVARGRSH